MDECKRHAVQFLEKEIKTYTALSLFLTKKGTKGTCTRGREKYLDLPLVLQRENEGSEKTCWRTQKITLGLNLC